MRTLVAAILAAALAAPAPAAAPPLRASGSISPTVHFVGDRVVARLEIVVDRRAVDPASVRATASFPPYEPARSAVERAEAGPLVRIVYRWDLACLGERCLPRGERVVRLPPARVTYAQGTAVEVPWPRTAIVSRLRHIEATLQRVERLASFLSAGQGIPVVSAQAQLSPWRTNRQPPPVTYGVAPTALGVGLLVAAALALAGAAALFVPRLRRRRPPPAVCRPATSPLGEALSILAEMMANGAGPQRREALERLARELAALERRELAVRARRLAWSPAPPAGEAVEQLTREAEAAGRDA